MPGADSDSSADFLSNENSESLARKLAEFQGQVDERQQIVLHALIQMLTDPVQRLKWRGGDARFSEEEEALVQALERNRGQPG